MSERARRLSWLNPYKSTENRIGSYPSIDVSAVVPDLEPAILNRLHEMQILGATDFAEHDIAGAKLTRVHGLDGAKLSGFDSR
jgi:hypothetical protein